MRLIEEERAVPLGIQISPYERPLLLVEVSSQYNLCGIALGQAASICEAAHVLVYIFILFIKVLQVVTDLLISFTIMRVSIEGRPSFSTVELFFSR